MVNKKDTISIVRQHGDLAIAATGIYLAEKGLHLESEIAYVTALTSGLAETFFTTYNSPQFSNQPFIPRVMISMLHGGVRVARNTSAILGATYDPLLYVPFVLSEAVRTQTRKLSMVPNSIDDTFDDTNNIL